MRSFLFRGGFFLAFPILLWGTADLLLKNPGKIVIIGKSHVHGDVSYRRIGGLEKGFCPADTNMVDVVDHAHAVLFMKAAGGIGGIDVKLPGDLLGRNIGAIVGMDKISHGTGQILSGRVGRNARRDQFVIENLQFEILGQ